MMLPNTIYERLPYLYLLLGLGCLFLLSTPLGYLLGIPLYIAGAWVWVRRSAYRRQDRKQSVMRRRRRMRRTSSPKPHHRMSEGIYEAMPFIYIAVGVGVLGVSQTLLTIVCSLLLLFSGLTVLYLRTHNRHA